MQVAFAVCAALFLASPALADWTLYEETALDGNLRGAIKKGHILKTRTGHVYEVSERVYLYEYEYSPDVLVLRNGDDFKLIVSGVDDQLPCVCHNCKPRSGGGERVPAVPTLIESQIDGEFEGWQGETVVKLMNGQIWQQVEYWYHYHYAYMPRVLIVRNGAGYRMKVEGIEKAVGVERLK